MAFAPNSVYNVVGDSSIIGYFLEADTGNMFEFSDNTDELYNEYPHKVWVTMPRPGIDSGFRYARVMKTRVKILVDEDVEETWHFKQNSLKHYNYDGCSKRQSAMWNTLLK